MNPERSMVDAAKAAEAAQVLPADDVVRLLDTDASRGLSAREAAARLESFGPNALPPPPRERFPVRLARQFVEPMAVLLIVAAGIAGFGLGERLQAAAILAIVVLNAVIALVQEGRAARALEAIQAMETPSARAVRNGTADTVRADRLVPGDVVLLAGGDRVPADLRLVETSSVEVDESILTGESLPVGKDAGAQVPEDAGIGDRPTMAFTGTLVTKGSARAVVTATGASTELGAIAAGLAEREPPTPLQVELRGLTTRLGAVAVAIAVGFFGLTVIRMGFTREGFQQAFLAAVALAVAAVPEGLATVVIVALALGVRRMAALGAIVRRLPAVETLGSTTVILTDKTGTLTENRMRLDAVAVPGTGMRPMTELPAGTFDRLAENLVLCNDASLEPPTGDPLEIALLEGFGPAEVRGLRERWPRVADIPFDAERRRMTTLHAGPGGHLLLLVKGAPEVVIERCARGLDERGGTFDLDAGARRAHLAAAEDMAGRGMRTLALARAARAPGGTVLEEEERDLTLVAVVGLRDPVRPEAPGAVADARGAGIRLAMVTGDHPGTAAAIADEVGLLRHGGALVTGAELGHAAVRETALGASVFARVGPDQKLGLVSAFQGEGEVVAVTGDGVNDAPALRRADIGVAMGRSGSDVAREAADMVIVDDNLSTIVAAVREGRGIYDNIRKVVDYLVGGNLSEITVVVASLLLFRDLGVPLLPLQLLWINLLTDGLPALALGVDRPHAELMAQPPRRRSARMLAGPRLALLSTRAALIAAASVGGLALARFVWDEPWGHARALMFTVLVVAHLLYAFAVRWPRAGGPAAINPWLIGAVAGGVGLQLLIVAWPAAHEVFGTARLAPREWAAVAVLGTVPLLAMWVLERARRAAR